MSPRTEEQYEAMRAQSRAHILQSALAQFASHGYERSSIRMIAEAAGISQGLLYNYFSGKEDLLRAIFAQSIADVRASFTSAGDDPDPRVRLAGYIRGSFALLRAHLPFWRLSYSLRGQPDAIGALAPEIAVWVQEIVQTLEQHFVALGDAQPAIAAQVLFALIDGISQHYALHPDRYPLEAVIEAVIGMYCAPGAQPPLARESEAPHGPARSD